MPNCIQCKSNGKYRLQYVAGRPSIDNIVNCIYEELEDCKKSKNEQKGTTLPREIKGPVDQKF